MGRALLWVVVACAACGTDPGYHETSCWPAWRDGSIRFAAPQHLDSLDSPDYDRDPSTTPDELVFYVSSARAPSMGDDLWTATRASPAGEFGAPAIDTVLSSPGNETKISFTGDGLYAVLGSDRTGSVGGVDVWETSRASTSDAWATPVQTSMMNVNTPYDDHDPDISADGLHLYLAPYAPGLQHLDVATRASRDQPFSTPVAISELDSGTGEGDPTVSPDETIIVFSSQRLGAGHAGGNLWFATRAGASGPFGDPLPVPDVNTDADEGDGHLAHDGCTLYFASNAPGNYDIYAAAAR